MFTSYPDPQLIEGIQCMKHFKQISHLDHNVMIDVQVIIVIFLPIVFPNICA